MVGLIHANLLVGVSFDWWVAKHNRHHTKAVGPGQPDPRGPGRPGRPARPGHGHLQRLDHQSPRLDRPRRRDHPGLCAMLAQLVGSTSDARHKGELAASCNSRWSPSADRAGQGRAMERHDLDDQAAFAQLRRQARSSSRKLIDVAREIIGDRAR